MQAKTTVCGLPKLCQWISDQLNTLDNGSFFRNIIIQKNRPKAVCYPQNKKLIVPKAHPLNWQNKFINFNSNLDLFLNQTKQQFHISHILKSWRVVPFHRGRFQPLPHLKKRKEYICWDNKLLDKWAFGPMGYYLDNWGFGIMGLQIMGCWNNGPLTTVPRRYPSWKSDSWLRKLKLKLEFRIPLDFFFFLTILDFKSHWGFWLL